jgi:hypothetical protein
MESRHHFTHPVENPIIFPIIVSIICFMTGRSYIPTSRHVSRYLRRRWSRRVRCCGVLVQHWAFQDCNYRNIIDLFKSVLYVFILKFFPLEFRFVSSNPYIGRNFLSVLIFIYREYIAYWTPLFNYLTHLHSHVTISSWSFLRAPPQRHAQ